MRTSRRYLCSRIFNSNPFRPSTQERRVSWSLLFKYAQAYNFNGVFMESPSVRFADGGDSKDIFAWRNDELARQMSHTTDVVEWEGHSKWFASSLSNANRCLLICYLADSEDKVGVVRFDIEGDAALISINLAPTMRGKGFAKRCLKKAVDFFKENNPGIRQINAEIKSVNVASHKSFEGAGFVFEREMDAVRIFRKMT